MAKYVFIYSMHSPVSRFISKEKVRGDSLYLGFVLSGSSAKKKCEKIRKLNDKAKAAWDKMKKENPDDDEDQLMERWRKTPESELGTEVRRILDGGIEKIRDYKGPGKASLQYYAFSEKELEKEGLQLVRERDPPPPEAMKEILGL